VLLAKQTEGLRKSEAAGADESSGRRRGESMKMMVLI